MPDEVKKETPVAENKPEAKTEQKSAVAVVEKVVAKNCAKCGKSIKRKMGYYRNGKYYCNNRCFKLTKTAAAPAVA